MILGGWLILAPWTLGFSGEPAGWSLMISGALVFLLALRAARQSREP